MSPFLSQTGAALGSGKGEWTPPWNFCQPHQYRDLSLRNENWWIAKMVTIWDRTVYSKANCSKCVGTHRNEAHIRHMLRQGHIPEVTAQLRYTGGVLKAN